MDQPDEVSRALPDQEFFIIRWTHSRDYYSLLAVGPSHTRGPLGASVDAGSLFGRMPLEIGGDVDGLAISVQKGRSAVFVLRNSNPSHPGCTTNLEIRISSLEDWAADLDRTATVQLGKPERLDHLAPGRYLVTSHDSASNCDMIGNTI